MNNTQTCKFWTSALTRRRHARWGIVLAVLAGSVFLTRFGVLAQDPQVQPQTEPSPTSILDSTSANGRIGGYQYSGSLTPTPGKGSRFYNNAKYGIVGNIVGVDHNSSASRFPGNASGRFQSKMDFNILSLRNELRRERMEQEKRSGSIPGRFDSGAPRLVTAHEPDRTPYAQNRRLAYGRYPDELSTQQGLANNLNASVPDATIPAPPTQNQDMSPVVPRQLWMRGRAPQLSEATPDPWRDQIDNYTSMEPQPYDNDAYLGSYDEGYFDNGLGGALHLGTGAISFPPPAPTPEQTQQAFQEYLEMQLLRSPDVNPLSPIEVSYQGGVATVRGVVPTPSARIKAGNILLADPRVSRVNNLMTYVRNDDVSGGESAGLSSPSTSQQNVPSGQPAPKDSE